jgi:osmotically-inducible protein OsmY
VEFRAGFDVQPLASQRAATRLTRQLTESPRLQRLSPIAVQVEGQTAILRGSVASAYDRRLAEQVVRMQPGIWNVKNELTVGSPP